MPVKFIAATLTDPQWFPVELGPDASIEIAFARPTLEDQLKAVNDASGTSYQGYALSAAIKDWRGVEDENGRPVPYSWSALSQLCTAYPDAAFELLAALRKSTQGVTETERKNSPLPPVNGGEAPASETAATTESSLSGAISSD